MGAKRNEVSVLSAGTAAVMLHSPLGYDLMKPFTQEIVLLKTRLAGWNHVRGFEKLLSKMKEGERVILKREPKNEYDKYAIRVQRNDGRKLGYIPRQDNKVIANLMDAGKNIYAIYTEMLDPYEEFNYVRLTVIMED